MYQLTHWWHWITYGQNSAAVSAIASLIAAAAASFAGYFAIQTFRATQTQVDLTTKQYWDAHKAYLENVRPHLIVRLQGGRSREVNAVNFVSVIVRNVGTGRAINIDGTNGIIWSSFSLAAGSESVATVRLSNKHFAGAGSQTFFLRYSSVDGRRFRAETTIANFQTIMNEEEVDISSGN